MKILFLDQSSKLGGAELCLTDIAQQFSATSLVGVFTEGPFPDYLRSCRIPVTILADQALQVQKASGLLAGLKSLNRLIPLIIRVVRLSKQYDLLYANTQKALVVGALASILSGRPLVYHLHDIVSADHFSTLNRRIIVTLANRATIVVANSYASREAFVKAGGQAERVHVVYNGFRPETYANLGISVKGRAFDRYGLFEKTPNYRGGQNHKQRLRVSALPDSKDTVSPFIIGHFSRLSPWKGQHVLIEALQYCSDNVMAILVGDALFGEQAYVQQLHQRIQALNLTHRVKFLGFRSDIPQLMAACNLVTHTSTAPEPFGRVIVEAMLCGTPVVAAAAGGAVELIDHGKMGWLTPPGDVKKLADIINTCQQDPRQTQEIAHRAQVKAVEQFNLGRTNLQISYLLKKAIQQVKTPKRNGLTVLGSTMPE